MGDRGGRLGENNKGRASERKRKRKVEERGVKGKERLGGKIVIRRQRERGRGGENDWETERGRRRKREGKRRE